LDETSHAEAAPEQRTGVDPNQTTPVVSPAATGPHVPSTNAGDTAAEQPIAISENSPPFLQQGTQPGSLGRLGHYEVLKLLGQGAFGTVFQAQDEQLQRRVAIKVLGPQFVKNVTARGRFLREARAAAAVNSKYVVSTYEVAEQPIPYLVMEYVAGQTLQKRIDERGALETREILQIGSEIAAGLAAAHQQGLIHRDIKPANILLEAGRCKIADFGLARAVDDTSLTQAGTIAGTPLFMSPEQARGETLDPRSDLFSVGSVLYTMCTGLAPFRAHTTLGVLKRVCDDTPRPIREVNADIPEALVAIVNRLLEKDPAGRFQTAAEVADLLKQHLDNPSQPFPSQGLVGVEPPVDWPAVSARSPEAPSPKTRRRSRWSWVAAAALVILPVLTLTLTEAVGVTHLFRSARTLTDPDNPGSEPSSSGANDAQAEKQLPAGHEKLIEKEATTASAAREGNPFKKVKIGDRAEYKITFVQNFSDRDGNKLSTELLRAGVFLMEVTAKTEETAEIRAISPVRSGQTKEVTEEIDLAEPYSPRRLLTDLFPPRSGQFEQVDSGTEKVKVGEKEYETSRTKLTAKVKDGQGVALFTLTYWMSRSGPLGGLVRAELTEVVDILGAVREVKIAIESPP
jgi:serine/threonine protein kinase